MYRRFLKRLFDTVLVVLALPVVLPLFMVIAAAILFDSPGPVFFIQYRVGRNREPFRIFKFRTMYCTSPGDIPTRLLKDSSQHITAVGKFLRRYSLDELPQLINVVLGDISLVGPRPVLANEVKLIEERDKYGANAVRPGITGLAQIRGRDVLKPATKARYDGEYAKRLSFGLDLYILVSTIPVVIRGRGVVEGGTRVRQRR